MTLQPSPSKSRGAARPAATLFTATKSEVFCGNLAGLLRRAFSARDCRLELRASAWSAAMHNNKIYMCITATLLNYSAGRFRQEFPDWNTVLVKDLTRKIRACNACCALGGGRAASLKGDWGWRVDCGAAKDLIAWLVQRNFALNSARRSFNLDVTSGLPRTIGRGSSTEWPSGELLDDQGSD